MGRDEKGGIIMIYDPTSLDKREFNVDVCIIGSGAGGATAAARITEMGLSVLIIEEGPYVDRNDFNQDSRVLIPKMYRRAAGLATDNMEFRILQGRVYGGSTTINWMTSLRTPDHVLEEWMSDYKLENYSPKDMLPHFKRVEKRLNVHKVPDDEHSEQNRLILIGAQKLGIHSDALPNNSKGCIGCGTCGLGCPYDAKQDMRQTHLKDSLDKGAIVLTEVRADKIEYISKDHQVVHAEVLASNYGKLNYGLKVKSKRVVVAAGAIYTPLILQSSGLTKSKVVGKYFHIHPVTGVYATFNRDIYPTYGIPQSAVSEEYHDLDGNGYGFWLEAPDLEPFLVGVNAPAFGPERRDLIKKLNQSGVLLVLVRDGANKKSNGEIRWRRGFNPQNGSFNIRKVPSIRYKLSKPDLEHLIRGTENAAEVLFAAGATDVYTFHTRDYHFKTSDEIPRIRKLSFAANNVSKFSAHPLGTARMANIKEISVVDETMQMHHYPGVYVMDGSTLPTAPGVNPMISILASVSRAFELGQLNL